MASIRGILNIQSLNELTSEKWNDERAMLIVPNARCARGLAAACDNSDMPHAHGSSVLGRL